MLDGRRIAHEWVQELQQVAKGLNTTLKRPPGLAVVLVGQRQDSMLYVSRKQDVCRQAGVNVTLFHLVS